MKKIIAFFALFAVLTASACGGNTAPAETTKEENHKVTQEVVSATDTTEAALKVISNKSPLFYSYLKKRMSYPLTMITSQTLADGTEYTFGLYIKDELHMASFSNMGDISTTVIYDSVNGYQLDNKEKKVYVLEMGEENVKETIGRYILKIREGETWDSSFVNEVKTYNGKEYDTVSVSLDGAEPSVFYFEKGTDKLAIMESDGVITKVDVFEAVVTDESVFEIPSDYERLTFDDLMKKYQEEAAAEAGSAQ